jgi:prophage regulatory protein
MSHHVGRRDAAFLPVRLLPIEEVLSRVGICRAAWYQRAARGEAPKPVKVGRSARWLNTDIDAWIEALAAARGLENTEPSREVVS